jgi:hypothetical protein
VFQSKLCTSKEYISFAPRLQAMPDVVLHPHAHSAMRKRLQSTHDTISYIEALKACDMAEAFQIDAMLPSVRMLRCIRRKMGSTTNTNTCRGDEE